MNPLAQVQWLKSALVYPGLGMKHSAVFAALVTFVNRDTGLCNPSIPTLAKRARCCESVTRKALQEAEACGLLSTRHVFNGANVYTLILPPLADDTTPRKPEAPEQPVPYATEEPPPVSDGDLTGLQFNHLTDPVNRETPNDLVRLVKRIQQLADKPGWAMAKAAAAVIGAVKRAGLDAVRKWFESMIGTGKRKGWELAKMLAELKPESEVSPVEAGTEVPILTPAQERMRPKARQMISDRLSNFPLRAQIVAAIKAAGLVPVPEWDKLRLEYQLAYALGKEV